MKPSEHYKMEPCVYCGTDDYAVFRYAIPDPCLFRFVHRCPAADGPCDIYANSMDDIRALWRKYNRYDEAMGK